MSVTGNTLYNLTEVPGNLYRVAFYTNIIRIREDPKPCRLCGDPVGELKDPRWSTNPTFLQLKHRYVLCPVLREPRQRILSKLSSLLMEETTEPDPNHWTSWHVVGTTTKSWDSTTINGLFSDENTLCELFLNPTSSDLPDAYRFKFNDPKASRIHALGKELFLSGGKYM